MRPGRSRTRNDCRAMTADYDPEERVQGHIRNMRVVAIKPLGLVRFAAVHTTPRIETPTGAPTPSPPDGHAPGAERAAGPVFVDSSGRRQRRVRRIGRLLAVPAAAYLALLLSSVLGGPTVSSPYLPLTGGNGRGAGGHTPATPATGASSPAAEADRTSGTGTSGHAPGGGTPTPAATTATPGGPASPSAPPATAPAPTATTAPAPSETHGKAATPTRPAPSPSHTTGHGHA
jgi:hypothetical protein